MDPTQQARRDAARTLNLSTAASLQCVRHAYLQLAKKCHPDVATGSKAAAEQRFQEIANAYEVLTGTRARRSVAQQYEELMAQRAREPWVIRWLWRGPSIGVKFGLKFGVLVALFIAAVVEDQERAKRRLR
jgi:curved DNA-binding protein CbpA